MENLLLIINLYLPASALKRMNYLPNQKKTNKKNFYQCAAMSSHFTPENPSSKENNLNVVGTPSPRKKRNNSTPTRKNAAEKRQILQQLISPNMSSKVNEPS